MYDRVSGGRFSSGLPTLIAPFPPPLSLQNVYTNLEEEFTKTIEAAGQKTKKSKQAIETPVSRKGAPAADPDVLHNKENVDRSNAMESEQESSIMDSTAASQRPVRARRTKLQNLVSNRYKYCFDFVSPSKDALQCVTLTLTLL